MSKATIQSILNDKNLRVDFIFYVNRIHAQESLLFWMEVEIFKRIMDADECAKQAKLLYFRYLHPSSKSEINVEGRVKADLNDVIARGVWDPSLFDAVQESVEECLKYSVVKGFLDYHAKNKPATPPSGTTPAHVILERYDGMLHRSERELFPTLHPLRWMYTRSNDTHKKEKETPPKEADPNSTAKKEKAAKKKGKYPQKKEKVGPAKASPHTIRSYSPKRQSSLDVLKLDEEGTAERRISDIELQQQIQLLRNLHQHQQTTRVLKDPDVQGTLLKSASVQF